MIVRMPQTVPEANPLAPIEYRPDIDGMRAVAVMLVLIFHFSLPVGVNAGFLGVDIFFVISGFLITSILKVQVEAQAFHLGTFYIGRIRRLAPALALVLFLTMLVGAVWLLPAELIDLSQQTLAAQFYVANMHYLRTINYFSDMQNALLLHTWSLAVEEQFYLIYPVCVFLLLRYFRKQFWPVIILAFLASFCLNVIFVGGRPEAAFYLLPTRAWELLMGALVLPLAASWTRNRHIDAMIALLGAILILAGVTCYRVNIHIPGYYALLPTVGAGCLLLSGQFGATGIYKFLSSRPSVYVGKISYSAYLVHWPVQDFASQMIDDYSLKWRVAMFALSIGLAVIVYHVLENPLRRRRFASNNKKLLIGYIGAMAVTLLVVAVVKISDGLPQRFPAEVLRLASFVNDTTAPLAECQSLDQTGTRANDLCHIGSPGQAPVWLVYGDSHAWAAHAVFDRWLRMRGQAGLL
jgi:peptidoglycan/LPS O-acetylase OafA/YrhL